MKIQEVMTRQIQKVTPESNLQRVAEIMRDTDVGFVPVWNGERVTGVLTDRDIVIRGVAREMDPGAVRVMEIMTEEPLCCYADQSVDEVNQLMKERQIRRLPVLNSEDHLVGIVGLGDIAQSMEDDVAGEVLEKITRS